MIKRRETVRDADNWSALNFNMQIKSFRGEIKKNLTLKGDIILACLSDLSNKKRGTGPLTMLFVLKMG